MKFKILFVFVFAFFTCLLASAQVVSDAFIQKELNKRGLDRTEVEAAMLAKGVDVNTVDENNPVELANARKVLEEVIAELESKKGEKSSSEKSSTKPMDSNEAVTVKEKADELAQSPINDEQIIDAVKEGSTVDEAVSEQLQQDKIEQLPEAKLYGHHLYRKKNVKFYKKSSDSKPPGDYIIGAGDAIAIEIWGIAEESMALKVNNDGYIKPDEMPRIYLVGLSIEQAEELIRDRFRRHYRFKNSNFEVNISTARTINVNISGEVFDSGNYNISALNNAINALVASGGPTDIGSVRKIKLLQSGKTQTIDLYQYLKDPSTELSYYLSENDYIIVPVSDKVVSIQGAVNKPYRYELIGNEDLDDLIDFAGGLKFDAFKKNIKVQRIEDDVETIVNVDLNEVLKGRSSFKLKNGDIVIVNTIPAAYKNIVSIAGAVEIPGEYAFEEGMRLSDLVYLGQLDESAILDLAYLIRLNSDLKTVKYEVVNIQSALSDLGGDNDIKLRRGDKLEIRSGNQFAESLYFSVSGAVRSPGEYRLDSDDLNISDAIFLSNGLLPSAKDFAYIIRTQPGEQVGEYINIDLKTAVENPKNAANVKIQPNDELVVFDKNDYSEEFKISISGAVKQEGVFSYVDNITVKDLIERSGGLLFNADLNQIDVFRLEFLNNKKSRTLVANVQLDENYNVISGENFRLRPFDEIVVRKAAEFEFQKFVFVEGELSYPGKYAIIKDNMRLSDLVKQAGGLTPEAFLGGATLFRTDLDVGAVIIDLEEALEKPGSTKDLILQQGDRFLLPKISNLVSISGATNIKEVYNGDLPDGKINLAFEEGKNAKYYINKYAGGFDDNADKGKVLVKYPNGEIKKSKRFLFFRRYPEVKPGSSIEVKYKAVEESSKLNNDVESDVDWGEVLSSSVAQATAVLSLILLIRSLD